MHFTTLELNDWVGASPTGKFQDVLSVVAAVATVDASLETEIAGDRTSAMLISPAITCCPCCIVLYDVVRIGLAPVLANRPGGITHTNLWV